MTSKMAIVNTVNISLFDLALTPEMIRHEILERHRVRQSEELKSGGLIWC